MWHECVNEMNHRTTMSWDRESPAEPPEADDSARAQPADVTLALRKHDRLNLELKLEHATPDPTAERVESTVELWFFLPPAVGISAETYDSEDFFGDLRAHTRLKTPEISLAELCQRTGSRSPLAALSTMLARLPAGPMPPRMAGTLRNEARLLCCMFRRAASEALAHVRAAEGLDRTAAAAALTDQCRHLLATWRDLVVQLDPGARSVQTRDCLQICDEALSLQVEAVASRVLLACDTDLGPARQPLIDLAQSERKLRVSRGDRSGASPSSPKASVQAAFWDQASLLKKYVSQTLFLEPEEHTGTRKLEHLAKGVAAAMAMAWTVLLQVATVFLLGLELNSQIDMRMVLLFSLIAVGGYILKDRIKDTVGNKLARQIPALLYDRRLNLLRREPEANVGQVRERVRFVKASAVPEDVRTMRAITARTPLALWTHTRVLHYQRRMTVFPRAGMRSFARIDGLTDILRVNMTSWVRTLDARRKSVAIVDPEGKARSVDVPNRYVVDLVARVQSDGGTRLHAWRVVLSRRGIEQVEFER